MKFTTVKEGLDIGRTPMGSARLGTIDLNDEWKIRMRTRQMLARALSTRSVVAFIGSGVSFAYEGRKGWSDMTDLLIKDAKSRMRLSDPTETQLKRFQDPDLRDKQRVVNSSDVTTALFSTLEREARAHNLESAERTPSCDAWSGHQRRASHGES